jgi:hypothetical protein
VGAHAEGEAGKGGEVAAASRREASYWLLPQLGPKAQDSAAGGGHRYVPVAPLTSYRTLGFWKGLSSEQAHKVVRRLGEYAGPGR